MLNITVEPILTDYLIWPYKYGFSKIGGLVTGSIHFNAGLSVRNIHTCMVFQDRWSLMAVVSQDRFQSTVFGGDDVSLAT